MIVVEIHKSGVPVIYRSKKVRDLIPRRQRPIPPRRFACVAQLANKLRRFEYEYGEEIAAFLEVMNFDPPTVHHVEVARFRAKAAAFITEALAAQAETLTAPTAEQFNAAGEDGAQ